MFRFSFLPVLTSCFVFSLFWAATGHLIYVFYAFLWRSGLGLLGFVQKEKAPAVGVPSESPGFRALVARYGTQLLGVGGALLSVLGFFWLLGDVVADETTQRYIQLGSLLVLTLGLLVGGYRIRVASEDLLGTGLMLLGFWMIPVDGWFYEEFILGYSNRSAYQVFTLLTALGAFFCVRTKSRTFGWLTPFCFLAALLLVGHKLRWSTAAVTYVATLAAPGLLALSLWAGSRPALKLFVKPTWATSVVSALAALGLLLSSQPAALPWLPLAVALLGGGTLAAVAYGVSDLRGLLVLVPYFGVLFYEFFDRYATDYGHCGVAAAAIGLGLLAVERTRRRGAERRRGLDPWCSVPALTLFLMAMIGDGLCLTLLAERVSGLRMVGITDLTAQNMPRVWADVQRAVFYLSRLDPALIWTAASGVLTAAGLAYIGGQAVIPLLSYAGGVPLAFGLTAGMVWLRPFELYADSYWFFFLILMLTTACSGYSLRRGPGRPAARAFGVATHLFAPLTYLLLGVKLWSPYSPADWWVGLTPALFGLQCTLHARIAGDLPNLSRVGAALFALPWPFVVLSVSSYRAGMVLPSLVATGLLLNGGLMWQGLSSGLWVEAVAAGLGIGGILLAAAVTVGQGEIAAKLVVVAFGLALLYLGARSRRGAGAAGLLLLLSVGAEATPPQRRITKAESLAALGAANSDDPLIRVVLRATKVKTPAAESGEALAGLLKSQLGAQSGIDSAAAALQIAATPLRLQVPDDRRSTDHWGLPNSVNPRALDFEALARRLPGSPTLPQQAGDVLDRVPADYLQLRFSSPESLQKLLEFYRGRGQALLKVTAPGLALPSPEEAFERAAGISLLEAAAGCRQGVLLIGDPYLRQAPDLVLIVQFADAAALATARKAWPRPSPPQRRAEQDELAAFSTVSGDAERVLQFLGADVYPHSLHREPDFRYASLLPLPAPDGRLFISEAAVRRLVSARFWIASNRRADCQAERADLEAALAFGAVTGRALPSNLGAARRDAIYRGWLRSGLMCRSGGALSLASDGTPACSIHGGRRSPSPLSKEPITQVYREEAEAYRSFQWRYGALYSTWIDPISVGVEVTGAQVVLSTAILPVARLPFYQALAAAARQSPQHRGPLMLPPGADEALASVAIRLPPKQHDVWRSWNSLFRSYYWRERSLWRLDSLLEPNPLGSAAGLMLFPGDPGFMIPPDRLWKDVQPPPLAAFREVGDQAGAAAYLSELVGGRGHRRLPGGGDAFGFRLLGNRWVYAAAGKQAAILAATPERLDQLVASPPETGKLRGGSAWMRVRPARLWEAGQAYQALVSSFLGTRCRKLLASHQNLLDLGATFPLEANRWPLGEPFFDPAGLCPGGGTFATQGEVVRCSLHGSVDTPTDAAPVTGSPVDLLLRSLDTIETEVAAKDDAIWTRVVLR